MSNTHLLTQINQYREHGFSVIPCNVSPSSTAGKFDKKPIITWKPYQKKHASDEEIAQWFQLPHVNGVGVVTGKISGILVLDVDDNEAIKDLEIPITPTVRTVSGGHHYYFKFPADFKPKNFQRLLPGIDIRGEGGFVVAPPSAVNPQEGYIWERDLSSTPFADIPAWLNQLLRQEDKDFVPNLAIDYERPVAKGERHPRVLSYIGHISYKFPDKDLGELWQMVQDWMSKYFELPFNAKEMEWLAKSFDRYAPQNLAKSQSKNKQDKILQLILAGDYNLLLSEEKKKYLVDVAAPLIAMEVGSSSFFLSVSLKFHLKYNRIVTPEEIKKIIPTLEAIILESGKEARPCNRIGKVGEEYYYDLFDQAKLLVIGKSGWRYVDAAQLADKSELLFVRHPHQLQQVEANRHATVDDFKRVLDFVHIEDRSQQILFLAHIVTMLVPHIPRCILVLQGSRGSSKSTSLRIVRLLIDPADPNLVILPTSVDQLHLLLSQNYVCCFDNISSVTKSVSDFLASMVTGGGTLFRKLYTNDEMVSTKLKSCLAMNGIGANISEPDLLERSLLIETSRIKKTKSEEALYKEFDEVKPLILGGLYTVFVQALVNVESISHEVPFRMADHYRYACAAAMALGVSPEEFEAIYKSNIERQNTAAIESSVLATVVVYFMSDKPRIELTTSQLHNWLMELARTHHFDSEMPRGASTLGKQLNRLKIDLEGVGIHITFRKAREGTTICLENRNYSEDDVVAVEAENEFSDPVVRELFEN